MTSEHLSLAADSLKRRLVDAVAVAEALGLAEGARRQRSGLMIRCPWHAERTPSCSLSVGADGTLRAYCFACKQGGDVFSLTAATLGLDARTDFGRILREIAARCALDGSGPLPPRRPPPPLLRRPPLVEVATFWARCIPVCEDPTLARALLELRGLDPAIITDRDLARSLPPNGPLPSWARYNGQSWRQTGHALITPLFDAQGELQSVHARSLQPSADPKGLSPAGHRSAGLVLACPFSRTLLARGIPEWWHRAARPVVIVCEGVPDFLTNASHYGEWESAPAILAVISGAWSAAIAARIPDGCRVVIRMHSDEAGQRYRREIAASLCARCAVEEVRHG